MAKFFVIDQSLDDVGGHHFDLVRLISLAAAKRDFDVTAGTHRTFNARRLGFGPQKTLPVFRNTTYTPLSHLGSLSKSRRRNSAGKDPDHKNNFLSRSFNRFREKRLRTSQNKYVCEFAQDCQELFQSTSLGEDDHALFLTMNELEFMGLAAFLSNNPETIQAHWHIVFHFGLFAGRPSAYHDQKQRVEKIRISMHSALSRVPYHQISFYASTDELVEQYRQLAIGYVQMLPYPVDQEIAGTRATVTPLEPSNAPTPLRLTIAGGHRREKGKKEINEVASSIHRLRQQGNDLRLTIQRGKPRKFQSPEFNIDLPATHLGEFVTIVDHPLPDDRYQEMIRQTDIGLLLYDNQAYYARRAGVLCEYLAAGCPVVVPSGCWLSQQIAEATHYHVEKMIDQHQIADSIDLSQLKHSSDNVPQSGGIFSFDQSLHPFQVTGVIEKPMAAVAVQFEWHWPLEAGSFAGIGFTALDEHQQTIGIQRQIVGHREFNDVPNVLFPVPENTHSYRLDFTNAYENFTASLKNLRVTFLGMPGQSIPKGAVGCSFVDYQSVSESVMEIVEHYDHYASTAAMFSKCWSMQHNADHTLDFLLGNSAALRYAA